MPQTRAVNWKLLELLIWVKAENLIAKENISNTEKTPKYVKTTENEQKCTECKRSWYELALTSSDPN